MNELIQIQLSGGQGSGKTTLAKAIAEDLHIPMIGYETRTHMPAGIKTHEDVLRMSVNDTERGIAFQKDLINGRAKLFNENLESSYVSDRAVVDSFVYYAMHNSMFDTPISSTTLYETSVQSLLNSDLTIILLPSQIAITDDGVRINNYFYYEAYASVLNALITNAYLKVGYSFQQIKFDRNARANIVIDKNDCIKAMFLYEEKHLIPTKDRVEIIKSLIFNFNLDIPNVLS